MAPHKASQKSGHTQDLGEEPADHAGKNFEVIFNKSKVQCICPNCGRKHIMNIRWIGRGVPRKFCQSCRDRETSGDFEI